MTLLQQLMDAYNLEELNRISSGIISAYKNEDMNTLRKIHAYIYVGDQGGDAKASRLFSKIIVHYHPDRLEQIQTDLKKCNEKGDSPHTYEHILKVRSIDFSACEAQHANSYPGGDVDFDYGDVWDYASDGYSYIDDEEREDMYDDYPYQADLYPDKGFFSAVKRKIYGTRNIDMPVHLLSDLEFVEMAEYEIDSLDGVEYCMYARIMDLSNNMLSEVVELRNCGHLEEIYLQHNQLTYLDGLNELPYLRVLDVSFNQLDDLSPLFEIESLEFLNVIGNNIPLWQLEHLSKQNVVVVH